MLTRVPLEKPLQAGDATQGAIIEDHVLVPMALELEEALRNK